MGAFVGTRLRVVVAGEQQISQVKVSMPTWPRVHIHMHEQCPVGWMSDCQAQLFVRLAHGCITRMFSVVNVTTGLQPHVQPFVQMQHDTTATNHKCRSSHMTNIGLLAERRHQLWHHVQKLVYRFALAIINWCGSAKMRTQRIHQLDIARMGGMHEYSK